MMRSQESNKDSKVFKKHFNVYTKVPQNYPTNQ